MVRKKKTKDDLIVLGTVKEAYEFVLEEDHYLEWTEYLAEIWSGGKQVFLGTKTKNGFHYFRLMQDLGNGNWTTFQSYTAMGGLGEKIGSQTTIPVVD